MLVKLLILAAFLGILGSLGSALYYLFKDRQQSTRTAKALTTRISLSIGLFLLLLAAYGLGILKPHGLKPESVTAGNPPTGRTAP